MKTKIDENVWDYWRLPNGNYIVKTKKNDGLDDDCDFKNTLPAVLGSFILSNAVTGNVKELVSETKEGQFLEIETPTA